MPELQSTTHLECTHADAFTSSPFAGNPACVVVLPGSKTGGRDIEKDEAWMQKVANEMHLSETAFLQRTEGAGDDRNLFRLRWFTPTDEVDLCGHATLAASHVIWERELA